MATRTDGDKNEVQLSDRTEVYMPSMPDFLLRVGRRVRAALGRLVSTSD